MPSTSGRRAADHRNGDGRAASRDRATTGVARRAEHRFPVCGRPTCDKSRVTIDCTILPHCDEGADATPHECPTRSPDSSKSDWRAFADAAAARADRHPRHRRPAVPRRRCRSPRRSGGAGCAPTRSSPPSSTTDLVGLIGAQRESAESVYLYSLWLEPRARGRGLGRALVSAAVDWARGQRARVGDAAGRRRPTPRPAASTSSLGFGVADGRRPAGRADEITMSLSVG